MILVLAGTGDGREIAKILQESNKNVLASVTTPYGADLLQQRGLDVLQQELSTTEMETLFAEKGIETVIDATHPFARRVSENAIQAAERVGINYIRYQRAEVETGDLERKNLLIKVENFKEAALSARAYDRILLTVGSKNLKVFTESIPGWQQKLMARILPDTRFVKRARQLGFAPSQLIAIQGPFSCQLNRILLQDYNIEVLITKASGNRGGLESKFKACLSLALPVILITRPRLDYPRVIHNLQQLSDLIERGEI